MDLLLLDLCVCHLVCGLLLCVCLGLFGLPLAFVFVGGVNYSLVDSVGACICCLTLSLGICVSHGFIVTLLSWLFV